MATGEREASMMKIHANEMVQRVTNDALQLFGGYGYTRDAGIERKVRDARGLALAGGTPQVLRNTLGKELLDRD
jgi:butyryl-CoA dehydrogenase